MEFQGHLRLTWEALKRWLIAQSQSALIAAALWLPGLEILRVPWAPLWALLAFFFHFVPHLGPVLALLGPAIAASVSGGWDRLLYVLILYVVVVLADGLLVQPILLKHHARVPVWASLLGPLLLVFFLGFWGGCCWRRRCWPCSSPTGSGASPRSRSCRRSGRGESAEFRRRKQARHLLPRGSRS